MSSREAIHEIMDRHFLNSILQNQRTTTTKVKTKTRAANAAMITNDTTDSGLMASGQIKQCATCGQPIVPPVPDLPPTKQRILDAVKRRPGITAEELRCVVWADDPNGGPEDRKVLHVHVSQLNHLLAPLGIMVRSQGGGYRVRSL